MKPARERQRHEPRARDHVIPAAADGEQTEGECLIFTRSEHYRTEFASLTSQTAETPCLMARDACESCDV